MGGMWLNSVVSRVGWWCPLEVQNISFRILSAEEGGVGRWHQLRIRDVGERIPRMLLTVRDRVRFGLTHPSGDVRPGTRK